METMKKEEIIKIIEYFIEKECKSEDDYVACKKLLEIFKNYVTEPTKEK